MAAQRAAEHRAAEQADTRYSNMLTFPDQTRKVPTTAALHMMHTHTHTQTHTHTHNPNPQRNTQEEMKMLDEHVNGESRKDRQTATERRSAGRRAAAQLAHYNLLSFHEDEVYICTHTHTHTHIQPSSSTKTR